MTATPAIEVSTETSTTTVIITRTERPASSRSATIPITLMTSAETSVHSEMNARSDVAMSAGRLSARALTPSPAHTGTRHPRR